MWNFRHGIPAFASSEDFVPFVWIFRHPGELADGLSFSLTLLGILLAHEFGHWLLVRAPQDHGLMALSAARPNAERYGWRGDPDSVWLSLA